MDNIIYAGGEYLRRHVDRGYMKGLSRKSNRWIKINVPLEFKVDYLFWVEEEGCFHKMCSLRSSLTREEIKQKYNVIL